MAVTPSPSKWEREIFIGADRTHYYTYLIKRTLPGSYYTYTDSTYLNKILITGNKIVERYIVRVTRHVDETTMGDWKQTELLDQAFNVEEYLIKEKITYAMPERDLLFYYNLSIENNELSIFKANRAVLLDSVALGNLIKVDWKEIDHKDHYVIRVSECHRASDTYYFTIQYGQGGDVDYYQNIILLSKDAVRRAQVLTRKK